MTKRYKVWAKQITHHYAFIEATDDEEAWEKALAMDGSDFLDGNYIDWNIYSTEEIDE